MKLKDATRWQKSVSINANDGYGSAVMEYAEDWANRMEDKLAKGQLLEDVAECTSHEAKHHEDLTGFMYGCAVEELAAVWDHGDALRKWHNKKYGVDEEKAQGGTVNPAILTVG